jgi:hypothetical protein
MLSASARFLFGGGGNAGAIKADGRGWDFITDDDTGVLRHPKSGKAVALRKGSNGWVHLQQGDTGPEEIEWPVGGTEPWEWYDDARRLLGMLMNSPGAHPLSKWLGSTTTFGPWKFTLADGGLVLLHHSSNGDSPAHTRCLAAHGYGRPRSAHELSEIVAKHAASQRKQADGKAAAEKAEAEKAAAEKAAAEKAAAEKAAAEKAAAEKAAAEKAAAAKRAADEKAAAEKAAAEKAAAEKAAAERTAADLRLLKSAAEEAAALRRELDAVRAEKAAAEAKAAAEKAAAEAKAAAEKAAVEKAAAEPAFEPAAQLEGLKAGLFQLLYQWGLRSDAPAAGSAPPERRASRSQLPNSWNAQEYFAVPGVITEQMTQTVKSRVLSKYVPEGVQFQDFYPEVLISYASGRRSGRDCEGAGPGMFYAVGILGLLHERGVRCFSGLHVPPGTDWEVFMLRLNSRRARAKVLIVVLTAALFQSKPCLKEINAAIRKGIPVLPIRFEDKLPGYEDQWAKYTDEDSEVMVSRVQEHLGKINSIPHPGTVLTVPDSMNTILGLVDKYLGIDRAYVSPGNHGDNSYEA